MCCPREEDALLFALPLDLDREHLKGLREQREPLVQARFQRGEFRMVLVLAESRSDGAPDRSAEVEGDTDRQDWDADDG